MQIKLAGYTNGELAQILHDLCPSGIGSTIMFTFVDEKQPRNVTELACLGNHGEAILSCLLKPWQQKKIATLCVLPS